MKKINIKFLTKKGRTAYNKISSQEQTWKEKMVLKKIFKEIRVNDEPLEIEIKIKIPRLAIQIDLPNKIKEGMTEQGVVEGIDYEMVVQ